MAEYFTLIINLRGVYMKNTGLSHVRNHPDYNASIEDVVNKETGTAQMYDAMLRSSIESRVEALDVLLKLK